MAEEKKEETTKDKIETTLGGAVGGLTGVTLAKKLEKSGAFDAVESVVKVSVLGAIIDHNSVQQKADDIRTKGLRAIGGALGEEAVRHNAESLKLRQEGHSIDSLGKAMKANAIAVEGLIDAGLEKVGDLVHPANTPANPGKGQKFHGK